MKRKAPTSDAAPKAKRQKEPEKDYCDVEMVKDSDGYIIWPATEAAMENARAFLREWYELDLALNLCISRAKKLTRVRSADANEKTLIVPDKDVDGLDAGVIVYRTLVALGLPASSIDLHFVKKGSNIHVEEEREAMQEKKPKYVIVVDQGSRAAPPVVDDAAVKALIIDHHLSDEFPKDAMVWRPIFAKRVLLVPSCPGVIVWPV